MASNTALMKSAWKKYRCILDHPERRRVKILGVGAGSCPPEMVEPFEALSQALTNTGYRDANIVEIPRPCTRGIIQTLPCRSDGGNCSLHNYGIAVDVDKKENRKFRDEQAGKPRPWRFPDEQGPPESEPIKLTRAQVEAVRAIRTLAGKQLFRWLGDTKINDTMHFEVRVPPNETQVDWSTVIGGVAPVAAGGPPPFPGVVLKRGSKGPDVCRVQARLRELGHSIDSIPSCPFGPQTEAAVKAFQRSRNLKDDGKVGKDTWPALFS
jgi:hypothetical protein